MELLFVAEHFARNFQQLETNSGHLFEWDVGENQQVCKRFRHNDLATFELTGPLKEFHLVPDKIRFWVKKKDPLGGLRDLAIGHVGGVEHDDEPQDLRGVEGDAQAEVRRLHVGIVEGVDDLGHADDHHDQDQDHERQDDRRDPVGQLAPGPHQTAVQLAQGQDPLGRRAPSDRRFQSKKHPTQSQFRGHSNFFTI